MKKKTSKKPVAKPKDLRFHELREWLEQQKSKPSSIESDPDFTQVYVDPASNEGPSFASFVGEIQSLFEKSVNKGYGPMQPDSPNQLYEFMQAFFSDDHALGEIVYKAIRYKNKRNPDDLVKIAGWAWLVFMHHWRKESERGN
jgi:hypothetical protein